MIEFVASRYAIPPWTLQEAPLYVIRHWFRVGIKNAEAEGALGLGSALLKLFER